MDNAITVIVILELGIIALVIIAGIAVVLHHPCVTSM